jgi:hypothetical protein
MRFDGLSFQRAFETGIFFQTPEANHRASVKNSANNSQEKSLKSDVSHIGELMTSGTAILTSTAFASIAIAWVRNGRRKIRITSGNVTIE